MTNHVSQQRLRQVLHYEPETGVFTWLGGRDKRGHLLNVIKAGTVAGGNSRGYITIGLDGQRYFAHRLAWFYVTRKWPTDGIDHIDTNRSNNRFDNLREANQSQNLQNVRRARSDKQAGGLLGVSRYRRRWRAGIRLDGKTRHIGVFDTPEEAHVAYVAEKRRLHPFGTL